jgi:hypothetical protein
MDHLATIIGHVLIFAATCLGFYSQWKREARQHQWQREAMRQLTQDVKQNGHPPPS